MTSAILRLVFLLSVISLLIPALSELAEETVILSMTATFREYRYPSPSTIHDDKFMKFCFYSLKLKNYYKKTLCTNLVPAVTGAVFPSLPPENAFHEWSGAFIGAVGYEQATLFLPFYYSSTPSPKLRTVAAYHIVPKKLVFSDLISMSLDSPLPTLLPGASIIITSKYPSLRLNDVDMVTPDLFVTSTMAIHGISSPLEFNRNGGFGCGETSKSSFLVVAIVILRVSRCSRRFFTFL